MVCAVLDMYSLLLNPVTQSILSLLSFFSTVDSLVDLPLSSGGPPLPPLTNSSQMAVFAERSDLKACEPDEVRALAQFWAAALSNRNRWWQWRRRQDQGKAVMMLSFLAHFHYYGAWWYLHVT